VSKKKDRTQKKLPTVEELVSVEQRKIMEDKAKEFMDSPQTSLAITEDVRLEKLKHPQGARIAARARTGKFISKTEASAIATTRDTQNFLSEVDSESGLSRHKTLLTKLYDGAKKASQTDKGIGGAVKAVELIDEMSGHRAAREEAIAQANKDVQNTVRVVMIPSITLVNPTLIDFEAELARRKEKDKLGPSFAEVLDIRTNDQE